VLLPQSYRRNNDEAGPSNEIRGYTTLSGTAICARQTFILVLFGLPNELLFISFLVHVMGSFFLGRNWRCMFLYVQTGEHRHEGVQRQKASLRGGENRQA
jgi:hypothetical protein